MEKALKALYLNKHKEVPKVHDLVLLAKKLSLPEDVVEKCDRLTKVYIDTRYADVAGEIPSKKFNERR